MATCASLIQISLIMLNLPPPEPENSGQVQKLVTYLLHKLVYHGNQGLLGVNLNDIIKLADPKKTQPIE